MPNNLFYLPTYYSMKYIHEKMKNSAVNNVNKYHTLMDDLKEMFDQKADGYNVAQKMNNEFWENLSTHRQRMLEQIERVEKGPADNFEKEIAQADSIYEATRSYIAKYQ